MTPVTGPVSQSLCAASGEHGMGAWAEVGVVAQHTLLSPAAPGELPVPEPRAAPNSVPVWWAGERRFRISNLPEAVMGGWDLHPDLPDTERSVLWNEPILPEAAQGTQQLSQEALESKHWT